MRPRRCESRAQRADGVRVVRHGGELRARKLLRERQHPAHVRPDRLIREQRVRRAAARDHLRLRDGGALELCDAQPELELDDVGHLVRLHVRPQPRHAARERNHPPHVLRHAVGINEQRGRRHFVDIGDAIPVRIHGRRFRESPRARKGKLSGDDFRGFRVFLPDGICAATLCIYAPTPTISQITHQNRSSGVSLSHFSNVQMVRKINQPRDKKARNPIPAAFARLPASYWPNDWYERHSKTIMVAVGR